ncbi:MAG: hypothetical protein CM15mP12_0260 [Gammaproteobacteria bacterium]|nr:MAG: hypothetical protein CM15mP12_0260 [Gammaproteobacteria bacterium]
MVGSVILLNNIPVPNYLYVMAYFAFSMYFCIYYDYTFFSLDFLSVCY